MLEYVAKFIELAHFADDYVATYMAKVRKFKDGLKLSIRGNIVGLLLQDMDLMVKIAMTIEREVDDAQSIRDAGVKDKRKESQPSSSSLGKEQRTSSPQGFQGQGWDIRAKAKVNHPTVGETSRFLANQDRGHVSIATILDT